jgi:2-hydroxycyclohexanecarboxyl-CoA dehydrogenase
MADLFALTGDVAVVTGGGSGFGLAIAEALVRRGSRVAIFDRNEKAAVQAAKALGCVAVQLDVRDRREVLNGWDRVRAELGEPTMLVNSAGIGGWGLTLDYPEELWQEVLAVNLTGTLNCCVVAAKTMVPRHEGAIVNIASVMGLVAVPGLIGYAASKAGVIQMTRAMAVEFAESGIRVNAVAPSTFETPLVQANRPARTDVYERLRLRTPAKRFGQTSEIVGPVLFLLSRGASMVTGHVLAVDGGYLAG